MVSLCRRLESLPPLSLWTEPFDLAHGVLARLAAQTRACLLADLEAQSEEEPAKLSPSLGNKFRSLLLLALESGDFRRVVGATRLLLEVEQREPFFAEQLRRFLSFELEETFQVLFRVATQCPAFHFVQHGAKVADFKLAKNSALENLIGLAPALAADRHCLYLFLAEGAHPIVFKVGLGSEGGPAAGQFCGPPCYDCFDGANAAGRLPAGSSNNNINPLVRMAHCAGRLFLRRAGDAAGLLHVMDKHSLRIERTIKLHFDVFQTHEQAPFLNTLFPLAADAQGRLLAVVYYLKRVPLAVRPDRQQEFRKLMEQQ